MKPDDVKAHAKRGLTASLTRQLVVQATGLVTSIVLARHLTPGDFGLFGLVSLTAQFFTVFAGTGLGLALVRQSDEPEPKDLNAVFAFQFMLTTSLCFILVAVAPLLPRVDARFDEKAVHCIWALAFSAWVTAFRVLPGIILERRLAFTKIAVVETVENLAFNLAAITLAYCRAGAWALVVATVARACAGTLLANVMAPTPIRWQLNSPRLRSNLAIGFGFQAPTIVFFLKDLALPAFLITMLGPTHLGYFVWVRDFLMKFTTFGGLFAKIAFPTLSKLSAEGADLSGSLRKSSTLLGLVYWPLVSLLIASSSFYIHYIFSDQWMPARSFLILFASILVCQAVLNPWVAFSQARSPWRWPLKVACAIATWDIVGGFVLIARFGLIGAGVSIIISNLLYTFLYYTELKRLLPQSYRQALPNWAGKLILNGTLTAITLPLVDHFLGHALIVTTLVLFAALAFVLFNFLVFREDRAMLNSILTYFRDGLKSRFRRVYV